MKLSFEDFKNSIGKKFRVKGFFNGAFAQQDTIIKVNNATQEVEGEKFIAHYADCRFILPKPIQLTTVKK